MNQAKRLGAVGEAFGGGQSQPKPPYTEITSMALTVEVRPALNALHKYPSVDTGDVS